MSTKNQPRQDPRIAPKEMIVTRRKSALQKRQLRDKDRSMKSITQLLKSPMRNTHTQSPKRQKVSPKAKPKKKPQSSPVSVEEKPRKTIERRPRVQKDRVWLKPKPNFRMVAKTNKRKLCAPQREIELGSPLASPPPPSPDIFQLVEDADSLDDEDLLEILTCPSPVWWEEPPHHHYTDEAICVRLPSEEKEESPKKAILQNVTNSKPNKNDEQKFMTKKKKLEDILGCIKSRKHIEDDDDNKSDNLDNDLINDEMLTTLENMDIPIEPEPIEKIYSNEVKKEIEDKNNEVTNEIAQNVECNELDKDNIVPENLPPLQRNPMHLTSANDNVLTQQNFTQTKSYTTQDNVSIFERNEIKMESVNSPPVSDKSDSKYLDTISDTNIEFIDKVEDKELDDTSQMILDKIKKFFQDKEKRAKKEYITVYKIVDNEEKQEIKNDDQSKINYFYKKCKNVRKKNDSNKDVNTNNGKTLALPNSEVKYCFKCSSIFETKDCHYCAMSESRDCVCDKSHDSRSDNTSVNCDLKKSDDNLNRK